MGNGSVTLTTTVASQPKAAADFYDFLENDKVKAVFEKYGFTVL